MYLVHDLGWKFYCFPIVLPLRTKIAVQKGLGTTCLFWLLVRGIPILITNNDIFQAVLPIENVCVQSFGHIKWALKNFVHGQTLFNLQVGSLFTIFEVCRVSWPSPSINHGCAWGLAIAENINTLANSSSLWIAIKAKMVHVTRTYNAWNCNKPRSVS